MPTFPSLLVSESQPLATESPSYPLRSSNNPPQQPRRESPHIPAIMLIERCPRPIRALLPLQRRQIPIKASRDRIR